MKRFALFFAFLVFVGLPMLQAQTVQITGKVTSSEDGNPVPGVSVVVKGTTIGTTTDFDGNYSLNVPSGSTTLVFSFVGLKTQEVALGGKSSIDVVMETDVVGLDEVVVTAYGIKTAAKGSTAQAQIVTGEKLNVIRQTNVNNALAGKVAGVQVRSQSAAALGRTGNIRLRGEGGFSTGQGAIYVVDGTILPNPNDINLDEVDNITVLSGPSASALFGSQGANGAIVITTKNAGPSDGFGVEVNSGAQFQKVYILPRYQNTYAGGNSKDLMKYSWKNGDPEEWKSLDGKYYHNYSDDASWGPRMVGQEYIPWYSWYPGTKYTGTTAKLVPQPDNARDYYETGVILNNSVSISKGTEKANVRFSYSNVDAKGAIPTTFLNKNAFSIKSTMNVTKKLQLGANVNFVTTKTNGEFDDGYSNQTTGSFSQWFHRNVDMAKIKELKNLRTPDGIYASWNHNDPSSYDPENPRNFYAANYWYNFYTWFDLVKMQERNDRLFGDLNFNWEIIEGLNFKVTYRRQQLNTWREERFSSDLNTSGLQTTGNEPRAKGYYFSRGSYSAIENLESLLTYTKSFGDFKVNALGGSDFYFRTYKDNGGQTADGLNVPNFYSLNNSKSAAVLRNYRENEKRRTAFGRAEFSYKDFLFVNGTYRGDWYSSLPADDNLIASKSFGASFVFSDLLKLQFLNRGKIRASWGEIPVALSPYQYPGFAYGVNQYQWNGNFLMSTPDVLVSPTLKGAVQTQKEIGIDLGFLNNRFNVSATYWDGSEKEIPYEISISNYSGFTRLLVNTGEITKKGVEFLVNVRPVQTQNFAWEFTATFSKLIDNKVTKIAEGIDRFTVAGRWTQADGSSRSGTPVLVHQVGQQWGQLIGSGIARDSASGLPIINADGTYSSKPLVNFGNVLPKYTGGFQNTFEYKNFTLTANIDYQIGGKFFSLSDMWGTYSGLTERTAALNNKGIPVRDPVADGGGVHVVGVDKDGKPVDTYIEGQAYFHQFYDKQMFDNNIYDLTFVKFRELSIGYNLPMKKLGVKFIQAARVSAVAQNFWLMYSKTKDYDPSEISAVDGESGQFPGMRSLGFNLKFNF